LADWRLLRRLATPRGSGLAERLAAIQIEGQINGSISQRQTERTDTFYARRNLFDIVA